MFADDNPGAVARRADQDPLDDAELIRPYPAVGDEIFPDPDGAPLPGDLDEGKPPELPRGTPFDADERAIEAVARSRQREHEHMTARAGKRVKAAIHFFPSTAR